MLIIKAADGFLDKIALAPASGNFERRQKVPNESGEIGISQYPDLLWPLRRNPNGLLLRYTKLIEPRRLRDQDFDCVAKT